MRWNYLPLFVLMLAGCADPRVALKEEGHGTKKVYAEPYERIWKGAMLGYKANNIEIVESNHDKGTIIGVKGVRMESWGENVITWIRPTSTNTVEVEVLSKLRGTALGDFYNWEKPIINQIDVYVETLNDSEQVKAKAAALK